LLLGKLQLDGDMVSSWIGELSMYNNQMSVNVSRGMYKGTMMCGGAVVVMKRLPSIGVRHMHNYYRFSTEIQMLGRIRHDHIVHLLGFAANRETNLLVYEYMPMRFEARQVVEENSGILPPVRRFRKRLSRGWDSFSDSFS
jgi:serine/threonine protein kinase